MHVHVRTINCHKVTVSMSTSHIIDLGKALFHNTEFKTSNWGDSYWLKQAPCQNSNVTEPWLVTKKKEFCCTMETSRPPSVVDWNFIVLHLGHKLFSAYNYISIKTSSIHNRMWPASSHCDLGKPYSTTLNLKPATEETVADLNRLRVKTAMSQSHG